MADVDFRITLDEVNPQSGPGGVPPIRDAISAGASLGAGIPVPLPVTIASPLPVPVSGGGSGGGSGFDAQQLMGSGGGGVAEAGGEDAAAEVAEGSALGPEGAAAAVALVAVQAAAKGIKETIDFTKVAITDLGHSAAESASNNYLPAFNRSVSAAASVAEKLPGVGGIFASTLGTAGQAVSSFAEVTNAFVARGQQLAAFSPDLAMANAKTSVRDLISDIHEADTLGPSLAKLTDTQNEFWNEIKEILLPVKVTIVETLADWLKQALAMLRDWKGDIAGFLLAIPVYVDAMIAAINLQGELAVDLAKEANRTWSLEAKRIRMLLDKKDGNTFLARQIAELDRAAAGVGGVGDRPNRLGDGGGVPNVPLVQGF